VEGQRKLLEVVVALRSPRCLACGLNGWQQKCHQDADDGNYDEQLDKRKAASAPGTLGTWNHVSTSLH
jgi:hypothetical protein